MMIQLLKTLSTNLKLILILSFLLASSYSDLAFGQTPENFRNEPLEKLLKENALKEAKAILKEKQTELATLPLDEQVYYLNKLSQVGLMEGDFASALQQAKDAEKKLEELPKSPRWGETYRALCFAFIRTGKLDSALNYAEKLYDFTKASEDIAMRRSALLAMGNISLQNKSYQKSLEFYSEALQITQKLQDSINLKVDFYNVGLALAQLNEQQKSEEYLLKAAARAEKEQAWDLLARTYGTLADNYIDQNDFETQIFYLQKANAIAKKIGNTQLLAMGLANLTETALRNRDYNQAIEWGKESLSHLINRPIIQLQTKVDSMLYVSYKETGNFKEALLQLESYDKNQLKLRSQAQKEKLDQLTLQFEVEKKDLLIQTHASQLEEEKAKNRLLVIGIASLSMIGFFLSYINLKNARTRRIFFKKDQEVDLQLSQIRQSENSNPFINLDFVLEQENAEGLDHQKLFSEILRFIQSKKLYLDPKFNQQTLVSEFGTNRQYIYEAISKNGDDNFRGLINRFRITEAKKIIEQNTLSNQFIDFSHLSESVGFNSYSTFYRAFKTITGLTPNEYVKELNHEHKIKGQRVPAS